MHAKLIWFTGLSGSGKTTLAEKLFWFFVGKEYKVRIIDGDAIREKDGKNRFTPEEIINNNQRIIDLCIDLQKDYDYLLVTVIAPFENTREKAKERFSNNYIEVYVKADLETVMERDTKGLYKEAMQGNLKNMIGFNSNVPYEEPVNPAIILNTKKETVDKSFSKLKYFFELK